MCFLIIRKQGKAMGLSYSGRDVREERPGTPNNLVSKAKVVIKICSGARARRRNGKSRSRIV